MCWSVVKKHITNTLRVLGYADVDKFACTTGCRASKFSVHVLCSTFFCDSSVLTMPLVVFEIARSFAKDNLDWLTQNRGEWASDEGRFRLRAMMVEKMVENPRGVEPLVFSGFNDGPYDEAIYSPRHLMRAPGCTKGDRSVCALAPLDGTPPSLMMTNEKHFSKLFGDRDDGIAFERFCAHLINQPVPEASMESLTLVTGWRPSDAYPKKRNFFVEHKARSRSVNAYTGDYGRRSTAKIQEGGMSKALRRFYNCMS